ncbi:ChbG/HpnK family deacetylase [Fulvivirgaceae bacterium BMA10]|uniref:ChbG/HpnK family deacetylase n=1 Tax=Splendidivirga corallicola TaxID=3051826 RepID=A0ABT8KPM8_9BACT|nr:ChbG/HpnK family deacetylase [Fulvivirgaceae bacterium BMA10]
MTGSTDFLKTIAIGIFLILLGCHAEKSNQASQEPIAPSEQGNEKPETVVLFRIDDIGMNHAVNLALKDLAQTKIPLSASVMFNCPWYQEAVEILKENPQISVGVHLTLNAEWKYYRWGPVIGKTLASSLVDSTGYFLPSTAEFLASNYKLEEVEQELEAQIKRALSTGLKIDYIDFHMRTALATPELKRITEKLAEKYDLKMSMFMDEAYKTMFNTEIDQKSNDLIDHLSNKLDHTKVNLVIIHVAHANPEMNVLVDMNNPTMNTQDGKPLVSSHRQAELDALLSEEVKKVIEENNIRIVSYADMPIRQP